MDIVVLTSIVAGLFVTIGVAEPLAARLRLPYSVILALVGIAISVAAVFFLQTRMTDALNPAAEAILELPIRSNVFLYVFLPTLIFQATLGLDLRRMLDDWVPILMLAVVAVVVATVAVGYALSWTSTLPLMACLLIGAIVSTTDPSAVVSIFRSISAPQRLARIIEGESLLNDAAAIALFGLFMGYVMLGVPDPTLGSALGSFPVLIAGGALTGWVIARLAIEVMALFRRFERAQISVSVGLPYLAYITAEQSIGASGVIAVVAAGITLNVTGPGRLPPTAWTNLREIWDLLAHWAGALIFILAALLVPSMLDGVEAEDFLLVGVVVVAATLARIAILFGVLPLLSAARLSPAIEPRYRVAILWGGLRGAVTLALALAVTESLRVPAEVKHTVGILATGFTLYTLLVQGTTLRAIIGWLGLDRLSPIDQALANQVVAVSLQSVREEMSETTDRHALGRDIVRSEAKRFAGRVDKAVHCAEQDAEILDRDRITLGLIALAGAERDAVVDAIREATVSSALAERLVADADRLLEAARAGGRIGYKRAARRSIGYGPGFRFASFLNNRLRLSAPLARMTAQRFDLLLAQRLVVRDLDSFIDRRIRRIHGRRVGDLLRELLFRRHEAVNAALEGLRLQYPGYAEELERRYIRRTALRLEQREYDMMRADGLIGAELYAMLTEETAQRREECDARPTLDVAPQKEDLIRQIPLFADLEPGPLRRLGRALRTRYVNAGDVIIARDAPLPNVFFIASGAVELERRGQTLRMGRGEMFGQIALLTSRRPAGEVRALTPTVLLVLDAVRFRRLLARSALVREAVTESARARGISEDMLDLPEPA